jgi:hypothetical protein
MAWRGWNPEMPVEVVGIKLEFDDDTDPKDAKLTIDPQGHGFEQFENLACAQLFLPDLDPEHNSKRFTWAMRGEIDGKPAIRFETWEAERMYSA